MKYFALFLMLVSLCVFSIGCQPQAGDTDGGVDVEEPAGDFGAPVEGEEEGEGGMMGEEEEVDEPDLPAGSAPAPGPAAPADEPTE